MPDVGEVRYKVKVDSGDAEKDIENVEKKLKKKGKGTGEQFAEGFKAGLDPVKSSNDKVADAVTKNGRQPQRRSAYLLPL